MEVSSDQRGAGPKEPVYFGLRVERLWKFTKKQCLASPYYENFAAFKGAIAGFLATVQIRHAAKLQSLLALKFQDFEKAQSMAA